MSTAKKATKNQDGIEEQQQPALRRSSRATRGSIKPVIDLTKDNVEDEEPVKDEDDDHRDEEEEKVKSKRSSRRSSVKPVAPKKTPAKRGATKKPALKQESETTKIKVKEEANEDDDCHDKEEELPSKPGGKNEPTSPCDDDGIALCDKDDDDMEDDLFYDLSEREMKEINNAFDLNKLSDEEELLNTDGIKTAMRSLGFEPRGDEVKKLAKKFASKTTGKVNRHGFHKIMAFKYSNTPTMRNDRSNDEITRVFSLLDLDKTGLITMENLRSIAKELNEELADEDLLEMIQEADQDGDLMINKDEFHNIMKKTSLY